MSMQYCFFCDKNIDTDYEPEHFNEAGKCISPKVGIDYYGREFYVSVVPEYIIESEGYKATLESYCQYCNCKLNEGDTAVSYNNYPGARNWFCSYDCVLKKIDEWNAGAERQIKREKELRAMGLHHTQLDSDKAQLNKFK